MNRTCLFLVCTYTDIKRKTINLHSKWGYISGNEEDKNCKNENQFREIFINNINPFLDANTKGTDEEKELIKQSPGSPLYYKDYKYYLQNAIIIYNIVK